jgi:hypothetical protein
MLEWLETLFPGACKDVSPIDRYPQNIKNAICTIPFAEANAALRCASTDEVWQRAKRPERLLQYAFGDRVVNDAARPPKQ